MKQYEVTGMSCAACSARVEKAVSDVEGVTSCAVSLLTNSMGVEGNASDEDIIKAVENAGYGVRAKDNKELSSTSGDGRSVIEKDIDNLSRRLITSIIFLAVLMYFSMGHMMWDWPVPGFVSSNHMIMGIIQLILTVIVMVINKKFFISGFRGLVNKAPNMDTLVALGSSAAFVYSTVSLITGTGEYYLESAAMILTLITVGKMLEARAKGRTTDALSSLMKLAPKTANVVRNGAEQTVPIEDVVKGDIFTVRPGESVPVDGVVCDGESAVNEASLTGESIPVDKEKGDSVFAATINQSGFLRCEATRVGEDTTLSQIIQMVSDAAATKAPIAKIADRVSGVFVPIVIAIAIVTIIAWLIAGESIGFSLSRGISVLVISCPCALGLATPVAIMVGNGVGAKHGILFKNAVSLEETGKVQIVALDKTGTITNGEPVVTDIIPYAGYDNDQLLYIASALESKSEHPLAKSIIRYVDELKLAVPEITQFKIHPGNGLEGSLIIDGSEKHIYGGNLKYIRSYAEVLDDTVEKTKALALEGKTPLFFSIENEFLGIIAVADTVKDDSKDAISELKNMGIHVVMLTGDNEQTAKAIGRISGVDEVIADVLPEGKETAIRRLKRKGKVAMVGDGINDAPALTRADIGIAIGAGTDVAIDAADVVVMKSRLTDVAAAIRLSRRTLKNIHENLFWAFFYNMVGIPLAAGAFIPLFGWKLNPMFGAAAMSLSSFCVVTNALRLNLVKVYDSTKDKKIKQNNKEDVTMEKTMNIKGMMCGHCEAAVKKALEELPEVKEAIVSHEKGTAVVVLESEIENSKLKETVEAKDYTVTSIE